MSTSNYALSTPASTPMVWQVGLAQLPFWMKRAGTRDRHPPRQPSGTLTLANAEIVERTAARERKTESRPRKRRATHERSRRSPTAKRVALGNRWTCRMRSRSTHLDNFNLKAPPTRYSVGFRSMNIEGWLITGADDCKSSCRPSVRIRHTVCSKCATTIADFANSEG